MAWEIRGWARCAAAKLPDQLEIINSALKADGWATQGYCVTSDEIPDWRQFYFPFVIRGVSKPGASKAQAEAAVYKASGSFSTALKDVVASFTQDVIVQSTKDSVDLAKRTAKAVEKGAFGIGTGIGLAVGAALVVLVLLHLPRGSA